MIENHLTNNNLFFGVIIVYNIKNTFIQRVAFCINNKGFSRPFLHRLLKSEKGKREDQSFIATSHEIRAENASYSLGAFSCCFNRRLLHITLLLAKESCRGKIVS